MRRVWRPQHNCRRRAPIVGLFPRGQLHQVMVLRPLRGALLALLLVLLLALPLLGMQSSPSGALPLLASQELRENALPACPGAQHILVPAVARWLLPAVAAVPHQLGRALLQLPWRRPLLLRLLRTLLAHRRGLLQAAAIAYGRRAGLPLLDGSHVEAASRGASLVC